MPLGRSIAMRKKRNRNQDPVSKEPDFKAPPPRLEIEIADGGFIVNVCDYSAPGPGTKMVAKTNEEVIKNVQGFLDEYGNADEAKDDQEA